MDKPWTYLITRPRADKSEGGLGLVDGLVRKVVANVAGDSDRTVSPTSSRFFLWHGMLTAIQHFFIRSSQSARNCSLAQKRKTRYIYIHLLFFHTSREPAIGFSRAICHLLPTYLQFIPLPSTSSCLGVVFSSYCIGYHDSCEQHTICQPGVHKLILINSVSICCSIAISKW